MVLVLTSHPFFVFCGARGWMPVFVRFEGAQEFDVQTVDPGDVRANERPEDGKGAVACWPGGREAGLYVHIVVVVNFLFRCDFEGLNLRTSLCFSSLPLRVSFCVAPFQS